jgi:hypothetical protein
MDSLQELAVKRFGDAVVLRGVMGGKAALCTLFPQELCEGAASVFTAVVRSEGFDFDSMLSLSPSCEIVISVEHFIFGAQDVDAHVVRVIVGEGGIVALASKTGNGRRTQ